MVREVVLSPSHGQCPWERCNSAATQTCWGVAMCVCEPTSLPVSSQKKAASDALTAGQIQSCFYRQRENPLTVAFLGIICSPWVMWTTRWKKKRRLIKERKKEDNIITVFHYVLWASWTTLLPKDSSQIICTSLEKKCHTTSDVQKHLSFTIPTHSCGFHWDNDDNQQWLQPVTHFSSPL